MRPNTGPPFSKLSSRGERVEEKGHRCRTHGPRQTLTFPGFGGGREIFAKGVTGWRKRRGARRKRDRF